MHSRCELRCNILDQLVDLFSDLRWRREHPFSISDRRAEWLRIGMPGCGWISGLQCERVRVCASPACRIYFESIDWFRCLFVPHPVPHPVQQWSLRPLQRSIQRIRQHTHQPLVLLRHRLKCPHQHHQMKRKCRPRSPLSLPLPSPPPSRLTFLLSCLLRTRHPPLQHQHRQHPARRVIRHLHLHPTLHPLQH